MTSTFPDAAPAVRIVADVPHWSAAVTVIDNDLRSVDGVGTVMRVDGDDFLGRVEIAVPPGLYEVRVSLNNRAAAQWVIAPDDGVATLARESWAGLTLDTAMPLPAAGPGPETSDRLSQAAMLAGARPVQVHSGARLSLFASVAPVADDAPPPDFDLDVALLDGSGAVVATTADPQAGLSVVPRRMWRCAFDVPPGYYVLRAPLPGVSLPPRYRYQPLYLCAGMETHAYLRCAGPPDLATLSLHMTALGMGFQPGCDEALAADAVLAALASGDAERVMFGSERMAQLVAGEYRNPWLSVLAAHALLQGGMDGRGAALLRDILDYLAAGPISDHPDARALLLGTPAEHVPLDLPPTLRAGLRRVRAVATERAGVVATDGPLATIGDALLADSAWTAWADPLPVSAPPPRTEADDEGAVLPPPIPAFIEAFPASAPVYPMDDWVEKPAGEAVAEGATLAVHAAIIAAATDALAGVCDDRDTALPVALRESEDVLMTLTPEEVSRSTGVPLDIVVQDFAILKRAQPGQALADGGDEALRRPLGVLTAAIQARHANMIVAQASDAPPCAPATPIETMVNRLTSEGARLTEVAEEDAAVGAVAAALRDLRDRLLKQAHLVIVADETGRLRYCNRLLRDRLAERAGGSRAVIAHMGAAFAALTDDCSIVDAATLSPNSPEGLAGTKVEVLRRRLTTPDGRTLIGHVYLLRNRSVRALDPAELRAVDERLHKVTLYTTMVEFGIGDERAGKLPLLAALAEELRTLLPI